MSKMKIAYTQIGDVLIPNLEVPLKFTRPLSKFGMIRQSYMREHKTAQYLIMMENGTLADHLMDLGDAARERVNLIIEQMKKKEGLTESMKTSGRNWEWIQKVLMFQEQAEEIVLKEMIYV